MKSNRIDQERKSESGFITKSQGVSVVICCHNSANRIVETLTCLQAQERCHQIPWEVVLVDNNCVDETVLAAKSQWEKSPVVELRVVTETKLGLSNARLMGISEAYFEIVSFIDDDNRVDPDWICQLPDLFEKSPDMAAVGGLIVADFESNAPSWFQEFEAYFAVGPQARSGGKLDDSRGYLCGAGLTVRKSVLRCLFSKGFHFELVGRQGRNLLCSEDLELGLALNLAGWKLYYQPTLRLRHFMPDARMDWHYLRRLARGVGISASGLIPYYVVLGKNNRDARVQWIRSTARAIHSTFHYCLKKLSCLGKQGVGHADDLMFERAIGLVFGMFIRRTKFIQSIKHLRSISWMCCSPSRVLDRTAAGCQMIKKDHHDR